MKRTIEIALAVLMQTLMIERMEPGNPDSLYRAEEAAEQEKLEKHYTLEEVRAVLLEKRKAGYRDEIKALLAAHGAERLTEIDPKEYDAMMAEADGMHKKAVDEICELRDRVENLTLYLQEVFDTDIQLYDWLDKRHPGLPGYAPNISNN